MEPILRVADLRVDLDGKRVIEDLSFELGERETLVILGPNGAGKTVLLRAILGLVPHSGTVRWRSGAVPGYVPQRVAVPKDLPVTVEDFFALQGVARASVGEALSRVGLSQAGFALKRLGHLSSGQLQRALIASALIQNANVLIFDEPTAGIDVAGEETVHEFVAKTQAERGLAMILVTHDLSVVYGHATRALCINKRPYCYGAPQEVLTPENLERLYGGGLKLFRHVHE